MMTNTTRLLFAACAVLASVALFAQGQGQGLTPAQILKPSPDSWPTYHGDYTGRHYSTLTQISQANVKALSLAWVTRFSATIQGAIIGGEGPDPAPGPNAGGGGALTIKATPLMVNGVLYFSTPNQAFAA